MEFIEHSQDDLIIAYFYILKQVDCIQPFLLQYLEAATGTLHHIKFPKWLKSNIKRIKDEAKNDKRLIDATHGRRTRSIIVMDSNHIVLSAIQAETVSQRFSTLRDSS